MTGPRPLTSLSAEDEQWRDTVRAFAEETVRPLAREMDDRACLRDDLLKELFGAGLMGIEISPAYGGAGRSLFQLVLAIEELARADPAVAVVVDVQNALVASALLRHGSGDQKRRYLPRLATGTVGAYALSESESGSDALSLRTQATRDGTGYRLDGTKAWVTNAAEAGLFLVFARLADGGGLTAFLVQAGEPGVSVGPRPASSASGPAPPARCGWTASGSAPRTSWAVQAAPACSPSRPSTSASSASPPS